MSLGLSLRSDEVGVPEVRHTDCTQLEPGDGHAQPVKKTNPALFRIAQFYH